MGRSLVGRIAGFRDNPWGAAVLVAAAYGIYLVLRLHAHGWDPAHFITAGDAWVERGATPTDIPVLENSVGYDGQFYYRLALDPSPSERSNLGVTLDSPGYRNQRILYPLIARALAFGDERLIPWTLILVNLLAVTAVGFLAAWLVSRSGAPGWFALSIALYPGLLTSIARDLAEPLTLALILAALSLLSLNKATLAGAVLALAVLTRESAVVVAVAAMFASVYCALPPRRAIGRPPPVFFSLPLAAFVVWQGYLNHRWGHVPVLLSASSPTDLPGKGLVEGYLFADLQAAGFPTLWVVEVALLLGVCAVGIGAVRRSSAPMLVRVALVLYVVAILVLGEGVWRSHWAFLRVGSEAAACSVLVLASSGRRVRGLITLATAVVWAALAFLTLPG